MKLSFGIILLLFCFTVPACQALPDSAGTDYATNNTAANEYVQAPIDAMNELDASIDEAIRNSTKELKTPHVEDITIMNPNANKEVRDNVLNDSDNTLAFTIKKFACAMGGVLISSLIIFLILSLMNKMNGTKKLFVPKEESDDEPKPQQEKVQKTQNKNQTKPKAKPIIAINDNSPITNENHALKIFFEKTK